MRSLIRVPLRLKEQILGALYVDSHVAEAKFNEESQNLLHAFADQAAIAIENARLFDEVAESQRGGEAASARCSRSTCPPTSCARCSR